MIPSTKPARATLLLGATGASEMYISTVNFGQGGEWEKWSPVREWNLPEGDAPNYLYVQFRDRAGNTANTLVYLTPQQYRISAFAEEGGEIAPFGDVVVPCGKDETFTITPDKGHVLRSVRFNGREITLSGETALTIPNVDEDHAISVAFEQTAVEPDAGDGTEDSGVDDGDENDGGKADTGGGGGGTCFVSISEGE